MPFCAKLHVRRALALLLVSQVRLLQHVLALVAEDQVRALGEAALVRAEHDVVRSGVAESLGIAELRPDLDVAATALDVLLVLRLVLDDQLLALVAEGVEARGEAEKPGVLCAHRRKQYCGEPALTRHRDTLASSMHPHDIPTIRNRNPIKQETYVTVAKSLVAQPPA